MRQFNYIITDEVGIHARPAGLLVKEAKKYASKIVISQNGKSADATKLMALLSLGVKKGTEITVTVEGENEDGDADKIEAFFKETL